MNIINKTEYDTKKMRKVLTEVHKQFCKEVKPYPIHWVDLTISPTRPGWRRKHYETDGSKPVIEPYVSGRARVGGPFIWMNLPAHDFDKEKFNLFHELAWVYYHELYHTVGIKSHKLIPNSEILKGRVSWAE